MKIISAIAQKGISKVDDIATVVAKECSTQREIKFIERSVDTLGDTLTRSPQAKVFTDFSKKMAGVQSGDDLTILAQEFKKTRFR